ncbi:ribonuclease H-like domain-containing protein [Tanacetum coccineum]
MEFESAQNNTTAKLPLLKLGEYEMWEMRIKQYFQVQDYALWEVIDNGNSWVCVPQTTHSVPVTAEEKINKKNDVKARSLLLMDLPNEHQLTFSQYNEAKTILQKLVSRLAILGVVITSEDINSKFLRSLRPKWNTHVVVWMNKADIETMSIDDLYNNFKIVEQEVKKSVGASTEKIHEDDLEAMDLKWQLSLMSMRAKRYFQRTGKKIFINANDIVGYDKSKVECFNCHKMGHFAKECRAPRNKDGQFRYQDSSRNQESPKRTINVEDTSSKAMLAIDGVGFDWSDMAEEQVQTNMALMAFSDSEVYNDKFCSKTYLKNYETLKKQCDDLIVKLNETEFKAATYKRGLATIEDQLVTFRKNEVLFSEEIVVLKREVGCKDYEIGVLKTKFEKVKQEKESIDFKIAKFDKSSKSLGELLESQITDKSKKGLGYNVVSPPHPLIYNRPTKIDLSYSGLDEFKEPEFNGYGPRDTVLTSTIECDKESDNSKENTDDSLEKEQVFENESSFVESSVKVDKETVIDWKDIVFHTAKKVEFVKPKNNENPVKKSVRYAEMYRSQSPRGNQRNWNGQKSNQLGSEFVMYNEACFVCGSFNHLQVNCPNHQRKRMVTGNNYNWVDYNYYAKSSHPRSHRNMTPRAVLLKSGLKPLSTARPVYIAQPKPTVHGARPMTYFSKQAQSTVQRPFYKTITLTNRNFNQKVNTIRPRVVNTARPYTAPVNTVRANGFNVVKPSACWVWRPTRPNGASLGKPQMNDKGFVDSGCSRHMTGNIAYLTDFKEFNEGYVTFGGGTYGGRITGKGTLKPDSLDFEDVHFVDELKFNLFSVSQMCDKKNYVLFTGTKCLVISPNFKLPDESQILLRIPREDNMYSFDMKNIVPKKSLTCLVAKATSDESMLWHRRLGNALDCVLLVFGLTSAGYAKKNVKRGRDTKVPQSGGPPKKVGDEAVHKELGDRMERAATTASSLEAEQDSDAQTRFEAASKSPMTHLSQEVTHLEVAAASTSANGEVELTATIDGKEKTLTEASLRRHLKLEDNGGVTSLPNSEIFEQLALMGYDIDSDKLTFQKGNFSPQWRFLIHTILHCLSPKKTAWEQFSSNIATAIICLATNRTYNFSKVIFDAMVKNVDSPHKFLMYPRFIQICLNKQKRHLQPHTRTYAAHSLKNKVFSNMKRVSRGYSGVKVPLFPTMLTAPDTSPSRITSIPSLSSEPSPSTSRPHNTQPTPDAEEVVPTPHESPLHSVHSLGRDEGSLSLNELTVLCTNLSNKVTSLETELAQTKQTYSTALTKLIKRVQEKQSDDTEVLLEEEEPTELVEDQSSGEKGEKEVTTADIALNIASATVSIARPIPEVSIATGRIVYSRRSAENRKDKGKAIMTEPEPEKKTNKQLQQERLSYEEAIRLQEQVNEEEKLRIARDAEIARQLGGQEEPTKKQVEEEIVQQEEDVVEQDVKESTKKAGRRKKSLAKKRGRETLSEESAKKQKLEDDVEKEEL